MHKPNETLAKAEELMDAGRFRRLPVMKNGKLVGIVSTSDLLRALLNVVQAAGHIMDD